MVSLASSLDLFTVSKIELKISLPKKRRSYLLLTANLWMPSFVRLLRSPPISRKVSSDSLKTLLLLLKKVVVKRLIVTSMTTALTTPSIPWNQTIPWSEDSFGWRRRLLKAKVMMIARRVKVIESPRKRRFTNSRLLKSKPKEKSPLIPPMMVELTFLRNSLPTELKSTST